MLSCCHNDSCPDVLVRKYRCLIIIATLVFTIAGAVCASAATGYPDEISNISVQNVTPTSADIVWDTVHPSNSQVVLARDTNYQGERRINGTDSSLVNHHQVTIDRLMPYDPVQGTGTYYFYVVCTDVHGVTSTSPGPYNWDTGDPATYLLPLQTALPDPNGQSNYLIYTYGPLNVYAGSDLYFAVQVAQIAGNHPLIYVHNRSGYNNGSDGMVKAAAAATARGLTPETISVHLACSEYNPNNSDSYDQYYDAGKNMGFCYNSQYNLMTVRLRTSAKTARGNYAVTITLQDNGQDVSTTYYFTVLSAPTAPLARETYPSPIPGQDTWESYMTQLGHKYCDNVNYSGSRDGLNAAGSFLTSFDGRDQDDAWYYDGGRVYQQIESYTNDSSWNHCALTILDPYRQWILANSGKLPLYAIFPYGMAMNYWRTGDTSNLDAIKTMESVPSGAQTGGWVDPYWIRETAYGADVRITYELLTGKRDRLLAKNIDKLLGHLDMLDNGRLGASHPFMVGLAMETAIHYYDMTVAEGHPDYRVPAAVKRALDALWRDYYVPATHALRYTRWDIPTVDYWTELNDLVAPAYAWYWSLTGDTMSLSRGDELFQHTFDDPEQCTWNGKAFSQIYKWSFDFVRWRSGITGSTTVQDNNPFAGPYPDTEPPIETQVAANVTDTTATFTWKTYENADSQVVYGFASGYYPQQSVLLDTGGGTTSHSVTVTGLQPGATYHYRIDSRDAAKNLASLADATFTTAAGGNNGGGGGTVNGGGTIAGGGSGNTGGGTITGGGSGNTGGGTITGGGSGSSGSGTVTGSGSSLSGSGDSTTSGAASGSGTASAGAAPGSSASSHSGAYANKAMLMQ